MSFIKNSIFGTFGPLIPSLLYFQLFPIADGLVPPHVRPFQIPTEERGHDKRGDEKKRNPTGSSSHDHILIELRNSVKPRKTFKTSTSQPAVSSHYQSEVTKYTCIVTCECNHFPAPPQSAYQSLCWGYGGRRRRQTAKASLQCSFQPQPQVQADQSSRCPSDGGSHSQPKPPGEDCGSVQSSRSSSSKGYRGLLPESHS